MGPEQSLVMEQEVDTLLRKEAIERVPPLSRECRFYSRYFIFPKKDGGLRPIIDLHLLNCAIKCFQNQIQNQNELYWPGIFTHTRNLL